MGGVKDTATFKTSDPPEVRITNYTHKDFQKILKYIECLPTAKDFKLAEVTEAEPDGGIHFIIDVHGKGSELLGRIICRLTLWFTYDGVEEDNIIGVKTLQKLLAFWGTLKLDKNLYDPEKKTGFELQKGIAITGYNRKGKKPPSRYGFTFKYWAKAQREYEDEKRPKIEADAERQRLNMIADGIRNDDRIRTEIQRLIQKETGK